MPHSNLLDTCVSIHSIHLLKINAMVIPQFTKNAALYQAPMLTRELGGQLFDPLVVGEEGALLLVGRLHLARDPPDLRLQLAHLGPQQAQEIALPSSTC